MTKSAVWPGISLDRSPGASTLRRQIESQLAAAMRRGVLPCGARLPSSRMMARLLGESRGTVVEAYEALLESGMLVATAGSGVRVAAGSASVPNFGNLKRTAVAAHYPVRVYQFEDWDGSGLYLNVSR